MIEELALFLTLLKDSGLGLGGLGALPLVRQDLVATGIATDEQVVRALAIGQLSTGPNGLWIVSLGYQIAGVTGAALALVASILPPLVMIPATAAARRLLLTPAFGGLVRGAVLAIAGLLSATGLSLIAPDPAAMRGWELAVGLVAVVLTLHGRAHPGVLVVAGAIAGVMLAER